MSSAGWMVALCCHRSPCPPPGGPYVYTFAPGLHRNSGESANDDPGLNGCNCSIGGICTEICTDQNTHLHHLQGTESMPAGTSDPGSSVCEIRCGANMPDILEDIRRIGEPAAPDSFSWCKFRCKGVQMCKRLSRSTPPLAPGGAQTPVLRPVVHLTPSRRQRTSPSLRNREDDLPLREAQTKIYAV